MSECLRQKFNVKVRKNQQCAWCSDVIIKGEKCYTNTTASEDGINSFHMHDECYDAWIFLIREFGSNDSSDFEWGCYTRGGTEA